MNQIKEIKKGDVFTDNYSEYSNNEVVLRQWKAVEDCQCEVVQNEIMYSVRGLRLHDDTLTIDYFSFNEEYLDTPYLSSLRICGNGTKI